MPIQAQGKQTVRQLTRGFSGVDLRSDSRDIAEGGLQKGLNVDLYERPGTAQSRRGFITQFEGLEVDQRKLLRAQDMLFSISATNVYVDGVSVSSTDIDADIDVDMVEYQGQNSDLPEVFIANGATELGSTPRMFVYDGTFRKWGITPAVTKPGLAVGAAGSLTGTYSAVYTYVRKVGTTVAHESNPSPAGDDTALTSDTLDITVGDSSDSQVTHIRIYRTVAGGSVYLFDQEVLNADQTVNSSQADSALGSAVSTDNDQPRGGTIVHALRDRLWTNDKDFPSRMRYTARFLPESQPADNFIEIGSETHTITAITSINGALLVFTESTKFSVIEQLADVNAIGGGLRLVGSAVAGFLSIELPSSRGCVAPNAVVSTGIGVIYPTKEGVFITDGTSTPEQLVSAPIQSIFLGTSNSGIAPIDFTKESNMVAEFHRGRYYLSYTSTVSTTGENDITAILDAGTGQWYFWNHGFSAMTFDDHANIFYAGRETGNIDEIEKANQLSDFSTETAIAAEIDTPERDGGDLMSRKLFLYLRVDAEVATGDTLTVAFYTDDTLRHTFTITGNSTKKLLRLPSGSMGFTWRTELTYSGTGRLKFHGVEAQWKNLTSS